MATSTVMAILTHTTGGQFHPPRGVTKALRLPYGNVEGGQRIQSDFSS